MITTRPRNDATSSVAAIASGRPLASITTVAPTPCVASKTASFVLFFVGSIMTSAPRLSAIFARSAEGSIAITRAPFAAEAAITPRPIGPAPKTATVSLASILSARTVA